MQTRLISVAFIKEETAEKPPITKKGWKDNILYLYPSYRILKMMNRIALFPGTFDPVTLGHVDIIDRALNLFDELVIGIGENATKSPMFSLSQREKWFKLLYKDHPGVKIYSYGGLTVDFCKEIKANFIVRGIRFVNDFEYEKAIAAMNRKLAPEIETLFLCSSSEFSTVASTLVRDVIRNGGDASPFLPQSVIDDLKGGEQILV